MTTPAGWYPDTTAPGVERYWDGQQWTQQSRPVAPPLPPPPPPAATGPSYVKAQPGGAAFPPPPSKAPSEYPAAPVLPAVSSGEGGNWFARHKVVTGVVGVLAGLVVIGAVAGGGDDMTTIETSSSQSQTPSPSASPLPEVTQEPVATQAPTVPPAAPTSWMMPNLVGSNLQDAQDRIQAVTQNPLFITTSHDLRGTRSQILDANWLVCTQSVAPGKQFTTENAPDFGVVRVNVESCP